MKQLYIKGNIHNPVQCQPIDAETGKPIFASALQITVESLASTIVDARLMDGTTERYLLVPAPKCEECNGTGWYVGFMKREPCRRCQ